MDPKRAKINDNNVGRPINYNNVGRPINNNPLEDRLSNLPDHIVHHILSLVPTKSVVQTSVLSKDWNRTWASVPTFEADYSSFRGQTTVEKFADRYFLRRQRGSNMPLSRFSLAIYRKLNPKMKLKLDRWLDSAVSQHVKEFKLRFVSWNVQNSPNLYTLPRVVLLRMRSLSVLKLESLVWPSYENSFVMFRCLKVLSLEKIFGLNDESLSGLFSGCPSIEELVLENCIDLKNPKVSSSTLRSAKIIQSDSKCSMTRISLEAPKLESLSYNRGSSLRSCELFLISCVSLKFLSLSHASFDDEWLENVTRRLPLLESFVIDSCNMLRHVKIDSKSLERLVMQDIGNCLEKSAKIIAPKLVFFGYFDESMLSLSMIVPMGNLNADIKIYDMYNMSRSYTHEWYNNLIIFLAALNCCKNMDMHITSEKALIIPNELRARNPSPLPNLKHLKVKTTDSLFRKRIFPASLRWISPSLETLKIEEKAGNI